MNADFMEDIKFITIKLHRYLKIIYDETIASARDESQCFFFTPTPNRYFMVEEEFRLKLINLFA